MTRWSKAVGFIIVAFAMTVAACGGGGSAAGPPPPPPPSSSPSPSPSPSPITGFAQFAIPAAGAAPHGIAAGPGGTSLWFAEFSTNKIGTMTLAGAIPGPITEFTVPTAGSLPRSIVLGSDGNLWFTEQKGFKIGRITPSGVITEFPLPFNSFPRYITSGPDGNLWFGMPGSGIPPAIGRMTTAGALTTFVVPSNPADILGIKTGPDNNLWFSEGSSDRIGRITTAGVITEFPSALGTLPGFTRPVDVVSGPDGNLWFTDSSGKLGRMSTSGAIVSNTAVPAAGSIPIFITIGFDGNVWFDDIGTVTPGLWRVTSPGLVFTQYALPITSEPNGITTAGGAMWFCDIGSNSITRLIP